MKHLRYGTWHQEKRGKQRRVIPPAFTILCLFAAFVAFATGLSTSVSRVSAAGATGPLFQQATGTSVAGGNSPVAVSTATRSTPATSGSRTAAPGPLNTAGLPGPQSTASAPLPQSSQVAPLRTGSNSQAAATSPPQGPLAGFPWWLLLALALVVLAGGAFAFLKRRPEQSVVTATPALPPSERGSTIAVAGGSAGIAPYTPYKGPEGAVLAPPAVSVGAAGSPNVSVIPGQIECPNCGTANSIDENFCHECGQDLKQARAQMLAGAADEPVDEYTPYLETLGRVDEQLEYVLSRGRIMIGSAPNNDIVIDTAFRGKSTVSPVHAELRRQGGGFTVVDRSSDTGTYVNNNRIIEQSLVDNDQIRVGEVRFVYHAPARD